MTVINHSKDHHDLLLQAAEMEIVRVGLARCSIKSRETDFTESVRCSMSGAYLYEDWRIFFFFFPSSTFSNLLSCKTGH